MAFQISYTDPKTGAAFPAAYLKITSVQVTKAVKTAVVKTAIYATEAARTASLQPVAMQDFTCNDYITLSAATGPVVNHPLYSGYFGGPQLTDSLNTPAAVNLDDVLISQAYLALAVHPQAAVLLTAATVS
jgi:hypothetical protein